ncbi:MAG: 3-deoxy-D-manno-octulosonic acid transferase [Saprospiraceae bacterium]|nr:3-deoxy-D-manno-octulosonic acid transferase [Saprospiraceae bacterium]MBK7811694.1 3-deoxy-D-manno-octulosonic acid transferase [Saprospiraceae bacterium]MBK9631585.1 3-deoxy-D-manno-octulosonic acid transferase [Saprospiraceae bacterium]
MWLYRFLIGGYFKLIALASYFRYDAKKWVFGRINWRNLYLKLNPQNQITIWIHCSSLGEFEQGRPLIEMIRNNHPDEFIWLSFFSPSGYEIRKSYDKVNVVSYFPSDLQKDVTNFLSIVNPKLVIFVKYDFWFETIYQLNRKTVPFIFISMHLTKNSFLVKSWMSPLINELKKGKHFFLQTSESTAILESLNIHNFSISGDTRLDRVLQIADNPDVPQKIKDFCFGNKILICGSVWESDLDIILQTWNNLNQTDWKFVIAPHLPNENMLSHIESLFNKNTIRYSDLNKNIDSHILIIDNIGMLSSLYSVGTLCYVGGGFGKNIHNILEPAAHLKPVCFGHKHHKFPEAAEFIRAEFGFEIHDSKTLLNIIQKAESKEWLSLKSMEISKFLDKHSGATRKVYQKLIDLKLLN